MAAVTRDATVIALAKGPDVPATDPTTGAPIKLPSLQLTVVLAEGTATEQRPSFLILESDYDSLGRPGFGDPVSITLSVPPAA